MKGTEDRHLAQLKNLVGECRHMAAYGEEIWARDAEALEWAINQLGKEEDVAG